MKVFVKICGLCSAEDVAAVAAVRPDALGFVFWDGSPRCVQPEDVADWTAQLPVGILRVGVFVDAGADDVARTVERAGLDIVQLHGFQSLEKAGSRFPMFGKVRSGRAVQVWRVVHIGRSDTIALQEAALYDAFVVDSFTRDSPGGTGVRCDWDAARRFREQAERPVILAGGLTPDNVREAIEYVRPWGVDVSSGVERKPRVKDMEKVERFVSECRR